MYCTNCGKEIEDGSVFCIYCGKKLEPEKEKKKNLLLPFYIAGGVLLLIIIGMVVYLMLSKNSNDDNGKDENKADTTIEVQETSENEADTTQINQENYADIVEELSKQEPKNPTQDEMIFLWDMTAPIVNTKLCESGKQYVMSDFSDEEIASFLYRFIDSMEFGEEGEVIYLDYLEGERKDDKFIYKKEAVSHVLRDWMFLEDENYDCWQDKGCFISKDDEYTYMQLADGEACYWFPKIGITENTDYKLVTAPCFWGYEDDSNEYVYTIRVLYEKCTDSSFGVRMVYVDTTMEKPQIKNITASSTLEDSTGNFYEPSNMIDGRKDTAWAEGVDGSGEGETITIELDHRQMVFGVQLLNGYVKNYDIYEKNGKIIDIYIDPGTGEYEEYGLSQNYWKEEEFFYYNDRYTMFRADQISFIKPVITDKIVITISRAVNGNRYDDTCVSEIEVY